MKNWEPSGHTVRQWGPVAKAALILFAFANIFHADDAFAKTRLSVTATMNNVGINPASFCTPDGQITIAPHTFSDGSIGSGAGIAGALLTSQADGSTYNYTAGNAIIPAGCYSLSFSDNSAVSGNASASITVFYNQPTH